MKIDENSNIDRNYLYVLNDFLKILRKDGNYDHIESHKKPGFHPLFRRYIFRKATGGYQI